MTRVHFVGGNSAPLVRKVLRDRASLLPPIVDRVDAKVLNLVAMELEFCPNGFSAYFAPAARLHEQQYFEVAGALKKLVVYTQAYNSFADGKPSRPPSYAMPFNTFIGDVIGASATNPTYCHQHGI